MSIEIHSYDIWKLLDDDPNGIPVITTNLFVKKNGEAVMGRGIALEAIKRFPELPKINGDINKMWHEHGADISIPPVVPIFFDDDETFVMFPVKPSTVIVAKDKSNIVRYLRPKVQPGAVVPGWMSLARIDLIRNSMILLKELATTALIDSRFYCPLFGCGAGELNWHKDVAPVIEPIIGDSLQFLFCSK